MLIDLHNHTGWGSGDSHLDPSDLVEQARRWGLDGIAITEHNQVWDPEKIEMLRRQHGFTVLGGTEVDTDIGHVIVFGIDGPRRWTQLPTVRELRVLVDEVDGVMIAAHPFRTLPSVLISDQDGEEKCEELGLHLVDAVEVHNGLAGFHQRQLAADLARRLDLPTTGGSDTHRLMDVATCFTVFEDEITNERELVAAIKARRCRGGDWSSEGLANTRVEELTSAGSNRRPAPSKE